MKVFVVDPSLFTPPHDYSVCEALAENGCQVTLFCRNRRTGEVSPSSKFIFNTFFYFYSEKLNQKIPKKLFLAIKGVEHLWDMFRFILYVVAQKPDIVHFQWLALPVIDVWIVKILKKYTQCILTVHDTEFFHGAPSSKLQLLGHLAGVKVFPKIIVHNQLSFNTLTLKGIDKNIMATIPAGLLPLTPPPPVTAKKQILLFGNIRPYKGPDILIEAFAKIPEVLRQDWNVKITGQILMDKNLLTNLIQKYNLQDKIEIDDRYIAHEEISKLIAESSIMAFPYRRIDSSGVFLATIVFEKAVVATRVGVFADTLINRKTGIITTPGNIDEFSQALTELISNEKLRAELAKNFKNSVQVIDWNEAGRRTVEFYRAPLQLQN